ncbi:MAG: acyl-CoA dehydrogenase family protein, partial [Rhodospirillales bacterium]|nr:acyl-CoA dehydrogenase family protein [Rhodospirillales bacterium]
MPHTEEQALIRDAAKRFAAERLAPFAAQWDREHAFPAEAVAELGALGLLGMLVPDEWGGGGAGYLAYAMAVEEIAAITFTEKAAAELADRFRRSLEDVARHDDDPDRQRHAEAALADV